jgi:nitrogen fixation NifU-like protein
LDSKDFSEIEEMVMAGARENFSETVIDHAMNPRNVGDMQDADGLAILTGVCGDTMGIWLKVKNDTIKDISFVTDGCGTSVAAGSMVTEMAKGKNIRESQKISPDNILDALGGLPEESEHCAELASTALKAAIRDYIAMKKEPWKKAYRK